MNNNETLKLQKVEDFGGNNNKKPFKEKVKINKWYLLSAFFLIMIGVFSVFFCLLMNNSEYVVKQSIIKTFAKINNFDGLKKNKIQFTTSIKVSGDLLEEKISNYNLKIDGFLDFSQDSLQVTGNVLKGDKTFLDGTILYNKDKAYIASDTLLEHNFLISKDNCGSSNGFICQLAKFAMQPSNDLGINEDNVALDLAIADLKTAILNSINKDNTYRNKGTFKDENVNFNKYTLKLDKSTLNSIYDKLGESSRYYLLKIAGFLENNYDSVSDLESGLKEKINNLSEPLKINIYTSGLLNKFAGIEIGNSSSFGSFSYAVSSKDMSLSIPKIKTRIMAKAIENGKITGSIYYNNKLITSFDYSDNDYIFNANSEVNFMGMSFKVNTVNKVNQKQADKLSGLFEVKANLNTFIFSTTAGIEANYEITDKITLQALDIRDAYTYDKISQEEINNANSKLDELFQEIFGTYFDADENY